MIVKQLVRMLTRIFAPVYRPRKPSRTLAIVVPLSSSGKITADEEVSLRHLSHYLGDYDKYLIVPKGISVHREGFKNVWFGPKFFGSAAAHNRLLICPAFYQQFADYEYLLMYHLDALVFSSDITRWCEAGFDYIGAPWIPCEDTPWVKEPRVGNGGFALMKIDSVMKVLHNRYRKEPAAYWSDLLMRNHRQLGVFFAMMRMLHRILPRTRLFARPVEDLEITESPATYGRNNDFFWSLEAVRYLPEFKVAPVSQGLEFAFEAAPRVCYEMNNSRMPFGCHAWAKFDRSFWEPHLLPGGSQNDKTAAKHESEYDLRASG